MLDDAQFKIDGKMKEFHFDVWAAQDLPATMQFWMAYVARDLLLTRTFHLGSPSLLSRRKSCPSSELTRICPDPGPAPVTRRGEQSSGVAQTARDF